MAVIKFSELTAAPEALDGTEIIPCVQSGTSHRTTPLALATYVVAHQNTWSVAQTFSATPIFTHITVEGVTSTGATGTGKLVFDAAPTLADAVLTLPTIDGVTSTGATGTGKVVFDGSATLDSPTLVTPALGTPASGTLTNCTGLPAAGVVGTAAVLGANTFTDVQKIAETLVLPKTTGKGIKVDTSSPTFAWRDIVGQIELRGTGANDPTFAVWAGNIYQYRFSATVMNQVFFVFHVPHDYVPGTDVYMHVHWSNAAASPNTGTVRWGFEYIFAKGFDQAAFSSTNTVYAEQASSGTQYQHMIAETDAITMTGLEVDSLIIVRLYRDAAHGNDTCTDAVFAHTADIHYQSTNIGTKAKAPNFYT